jgi:hypothetical protein
MAQAAVGSVAMVPTMSLLLILVCHTAQAAGPLCLGERVVLSLQGVQIQALM